MENKQDNKWLLEHVLPRIFDTETKKMYYPQIKENMVYYFEEKPKGRHNESWISIVGLDPVLLSDRFIKMMPTGQYAGDRLLYERDIGDVHFNNKETIVAIDNVRSSLLCGLAYKVDDGTYWSFGQHVASVFKYLGNSIENTELLEGKDA